jgi:hypothetical protein
MLVMKEGCDAPDPAPKHRDARHAPRSSRPVFLSAARLGRGWMRWMRVVLNDGVAHDNRLRAVNAFGVFECHDHRTNVR